MFYSLYSLFKVRLPFSTTVLDTNETFKSYLDLDNLVIGRVFQSLMLKFTCDI